VKNGGITIALRNKEDTDQEQYFEKVNAWKKQHNISMFDSDYAVKMRACPFKPPVAIDDIEKPYEEPIELFFDMN
jgi:hypothetical protein